jgi:hypothetical protein
LFSFLQMAKRKVILTPTQGKKTDAMSATTDSEGKFCFQVQPGAYRVQVSSLVFLGPIV